MLAWLLYNQRLLCCFQTVSAWLLQPMASVLSVRQCHYDSYNQWLLCCLSNSVITIPTTSGFCVVCQTVSATLLWPVASVLSVRQYQHNSSMTSGFCVVCQTVSAWLLYNRLLCYLWDNVSMTPTISNFCVVCQNRVSITPLWPVASVLSVRQCHYDSYDQWFLCCLSDSVSITPTTSVFCVVCQTVSLRLLQPVAFVLSVRQCHYDSSITNGFCVVCQTVSLWLLYNQWLLCCLSDSVSMTPTTNDCGVC